MGMLDNIFSKKKDHSGSETSPVSPRETKEVKAAKKRKKKASKVKGPFEVTFYGKPVRRYYFQKTWYFSVDDIEAIAERKAPEKGKAKEKDPEKLLKAKEENVKKVAVGGQEIEVVNAKGALEVSRHKEGTYPGPFARWIDEMAKATLLKEDLGKRKARQIKKAGHVHPSDAGIS